MPTIYAPTTDGQINSTGTGGPIQNAFNLARVGGSGVNNTTRQYAVYTKYASASEVKLYRGFFAFDTSGITVAPASATLKIYNASTGAVTANTILVKVNAGAAINLTDVVAVGDFDQITGFVAEASMSGNATDYSAQVSSGTSGSSYVEYTLTSDALADMASLSVFKVAVVEYSYDYLNNVVDGTPGALLKTFYIDWADAASNQPYIDYVAGVASASGWGGSAAGKGKKCGAIVAGDAKQFIGTATANTKKILGV